MPKGHGWSQRIQIGRSSHDQRRTIIPPAKIQRRNVSNVSMLGCGGIEDKRLMIGFGRKQWKCERVRIPHTKAIPKHEGMRKGYVTRCVPIARHLLPAITSTGRICESKDAWADNPMTTSSSHAEMCERPGIYKIASLDECDNHCVATDILTDGNLYMMILEVLLPEDNETESQPT
jgi:hypothetical protein